MDNTQRQFQEADATVDQAVAAFISKIKSISGKLDGVAPVYIVERALLELCDELTKLIDDPGAMYTGATSSHFPEIDLIVRMKAATA